MLVCSGGSAWGQEWAWASETPLGAFTPLDARCIRAADAELPQSMDMGHCLWLQCIGTHLPTAWLSLTLFLQPVLWILPAWGSLAVLMDRSTLALDTRRWLWFCVLHTVLRERGRKKNPSHFQSKHSTEFVPSIFNDTLWPGKWWLVLPYNSMVVCAERGENSSSRHPRISAAFLRGRRAWVWSNHLPLPCQLSCMVLQLWVVFL